MKTVNTISAILLLVMTGCGGNRQGGATDGYITVDVTKRYPKKELILQDIMDVEYVALETGGVFYTGDWISDVGKNHIVTKNARAGDIFIFDNSGKGLRKINRTGRGGEEYTMLYDIILDEENNDLFVTNNMEQLILVYDLYGNFKRRIKHNVEGRRFFKIYNFDNENLICVCYLPLLDNKLKYIIISKQDGSIVKDIYISFKEGKDFMLREGKGIGDYSPYLYSKIRPYHDSFILTEASSDTIFRLLPDFSMIPFIVRIPSVQTMNPEIFLLPIMITDRYYFMETVKKEWNFETRTGYPVTNLMYDSQEKTIYEYTLYNGDYTSKKEISLQTGRSVYMALDAFELVEDYKKGVLKGRLREIAAGLKEEDNPVIMLVKHN